MSQAIEDKDEQLRRHLVALGRERGYLLFDEVNEALTLSADVNSPEEVNELLSTFERYGIKGLRMKNIFIGNLSFQTTESDLRALFESFGQVTRIHIVQNRQTGQPRGFAFVEMAQDDQATKAMADLNGREVAGRPLRVNEAAPKPDRGPRGGFGGGGSGYKKDGGGGRRGGFSTEDYRGAARQPKEPRW